MSGGGGKSPSVVERVARTSETTPDERASGPIKDTILGDAPSGLHREDKSGVLSDKLAEQGGGRCVFKPNLTSKIWPKKLSALRICYCSYWPRTLTRMTEYRYLNQASTFGPSLGNPSAADGYQTISKKNNLDDVRHQEGGLAEQTHQASPAHPPYDAARDLSSGATAATPPRPLTHP